MTKLGEGNAVAIAETSGFYKTIRRENVTITFYVDDVYKFAADEVGRAAIEMREQSGTDGVWNGELQFWQWPVGQGQEPTIRIYDESGTNLSYVSSWQEADSDGSTIRSELVHNFLDTGYNEFKPPENFPGTQEITSDRHIMVCYGPTDMPEKWPEAVMQEGDYTATVTQEINNQYCAGDSASVEIELTNEALIGNTEVDVTVVNNITGNANTSTVSIPEGGTTITRSVDIEGPSQTGASVMEVEINNDRVYSGSADIGVTDNDIQISVASLDDTVIEGQGYSGQLEVSNTGDCSADVTVSYDTT